jgi:RNA polymerase sigma-70 factor (sigma-E family)
MVDGPSADEAGFRQWVAVRSTPLRRKAYLLSGSWHTADDLVQDTLVAVYAAWPRVARVRDIDAYVNRILVNKYVDDRRRPWRRERPVHDVPESTDEGAATAFDRVEEHDSPLGRALATLPAGQRAVLVLRYTEDLQVDEIARLLDLPSGTVKSRLSRGTDAIRRELDRQRQPLAHSLSTSHGTTEELS